MKKILFLMILIITTLSLDAQSQWEIFEIPYTTGYNGRMVKDISMINADVGFVLVYSSVTGGYGYNRIFKTNNKGQGWNYLYGFNNNVISKSLPAIEFIDENTGFVVIANNTTDLVVYKTTNGGLNWSSSSIYAQGPQAVQVKPTLKFVNNNIGYLCSMFTIHKTTNCGQTWIEVLSYNTTEKFKIYDFEISNENKDIIYAGGCRLGHNEIPIIKRTTSGGNNWTNLINGPQTVSRIDDIDIFTKDNIDYVRLIASNGIAEYKNGTLELISDPLSPYDRIYHNIAFWNSNDGIFSGSALFPGNISEGRIYRTTDGGHNWPIVEYRTFEPETNFF